MGAWESYVPAFRDDRDAERDDLVSCPLGWSLELLRLPLSVGAREEEESLRPLFRDAMLLALCTAGIREC